MHNRPSEIEALLPTEPGQTEFLPWLPISDVSRLARTCKNLHEFFQDTLRIERLAHYIIVEPNVVEVIKIVKAHPYLLDTNIPKVVNRKGQIIRNNKPFSLAFGAGDDEMCAVLKEEMIVVYGSEATIAEVQKQLSEKIGAKNKEQDAQIKNQLDILLQSVMQVISNEQFNLGHDADTKLILNPATLAAIAIFREGLAALQPKIIDKGMHFRLNTLQETYNAYMQAAAQWRYNYNRCALFEDGVLSSVLAYLPENDAQRASQGLYYLQKDAPESFARSLKLRCNANIDFYDHLGSASSDFSNLSGSCVDIVFGGFASRPYVGGCGRPGGARQACQNLRRTKTLNLRILCDQQECLESQVPTSNM